MFKIFVGLSIGFIIGYRRLISDKMVLLNSKLQNLWLILLIFAMGMSIGSDKEILNNLPKLGAKAFAFAIFCSLGSIFIVYVISRLFFKEEDKK